MTATAKKTTKKEQSADANSVVTVELVNVEGMLPAAVFTADNINEFIARIEKEKKAFKAPDATTTAGRKAIVSFANRFTKTKTLVDEMGKDYVAIIKEEPKRIDALRKLFRDTMDAWAAEIRKPVTLLEEKEAARKAEHEKHLAAIGEQIRFPAGQPSSAEVQRRIDFVNVFQTRAWEEFDELYKTTYKAVMEHLTATLEASKTAEKNAAELKKLKDQQAKQAIENARLEGIAEGQKAATLAAQKAPTTSTTYGVSPMRSKIRDEKKAQVNRAAAVALVDGGFVGSIDAAQKIIVAIVLNKIPNVTISYGE